MREVVLRLDPKDLAGTVLAIPVANPVAFARSKRSTPEEDIDFANMNRIFPGARAKPAFGGGESQPSDRSLTEWIAHTISQQVFPHIQYLIDFHCNGQVAGLIETLVERNDPNCERSKVCFEMNRLFNFGVMLKAREAPATASGYANSLGVITAVAEIGGGGLSGPVQKKAVQIGVEGVLNVLRYLKMIPGEPTVPNKQLYCITQPHVRPTKAGYLLSEFEPDDLLADLPLGVPVSQGDLLGVVFDPYTFEELEQLLAPADGVLYSCRTSGPIEAGSHAYAVAAYEGGRWID